MRGEGLEDIGTTGKITVGSGSGKQREVTLCVGDGGVKEWRGNKCSRTLLTVICWDPWKPGP